MLAIKSRHFPVEISGGFKYADNYFCCDNYNCCCYRLFYHPSDMQGISHLISKKQTFPPSAGCISDTFCRIPGSKKGNVSKRSLRQPLLLYFCPFTASLFHGNRSEPRRNCPLIQRYRHHGLLPDGPFCHPPAELWPD